MVSYYAIKSRGIPVAGGWHTPSGWTLNSRVCHAGLDASRYHHKTQAGEEDDEEARARLLSEEERYKICERLNLVCQYKSCGRKNIIDCPVRPGQVCSYPECLSGREGKTCISPTPYLELCMPLYGRLYVHEYEFHVLEQFSDVHTLHGNLCKNYLNASQSLQIIFSSEKLWEYISTCSQ